MVELKEVYHRFAPQIIYIVAVPLFFIAFLLVYSPGWCVRFLDFGKFGYHFHVTMLTCIVAGGCGLGRSILYVLRRNITNTMYYAWCLLEIAVTSLFAALYIWLMSGTETAYFPAVAESFAIISLTCIYPYTVIHLSLLLHYTKKKSEASVTLPDDRIRFYDSRKNLKFAAMVSSVFYLSADENYVNIHYSDDNGKMRAFVLRSSMKSIEDICATHSLVRCHRSYIVNPEHVRILRKDSRGLLFADLDTPEPVSVPVTKTYYDRLAELI
ncbi:MAG: LytTR family DNA-binding domain-containing protein [Candidatus Cryptobacteroides sp.]